MTMKTPDIYTDHPPSVKVALCQVHTEPWAVQANLQRTLDALDAAAGEGAELAITPECVLHGYANTCDDFARRMLEVAEPAAGPNIGRVRAKARELKMDVVLGFAERGDGQTLLNSAAFISRDGKILAIYRKVHCRDFESLRHAGRFTPGDTFEVVQRTFGGHTFNIGLMICFDREVAESVRCLRAMGAQLIACPLATDTGELSQPINYADNEMVTRVRAAENEVFIAVVNHAVRFNGGSFIVGPGGQTIVQLGPEAAVHVESLPVGVIAAQFHNKPLGWMGWGYRRPEVYARHLGPDPARR